MAKFSSGPGVVRPKARPASATLKVEMAKRGKNADPARPDWFYFKRGG
jgi:hypothetical protein